MRFKVFRTTKITPKLICTAFKLRKQRFFKTKTCKNGHSEVFYKKGILENFTKFIGKHLCRSLFFNIAAGLRRFSFALWWSCTQKLRKIHRKITVPESPFHKSPVNNFLLQTLTFSRKQWRLTVIQLWVGYLTTILIRFFYLF